MEKILKCYNSVENLKDIIKANMPSLKGYSIRGKYNDITIRFVNISDDDYDEVSELLDEYVYNDSEMSIVETLADFLKSNKIIVATAESCTGGMLASRFVNIPGISEVFYEGVVTYSNEAKMQRLGVNQSTLDKFGAVSEETAMEMANGLLNGVVSLGVSTTGIAGPDGGSTEKPVGLVYIGIAGENSCEVIKSVFEGDRRTIRITATNAALFYAYRHVLKYY